MIFSLGKGINQMTISKVFFVILAALGLTIASPSYSQATEDSNNYYAKGKQAYAQKNFKTAAKFFKEGSIKGNADAQHALAAMYINGEGVPMNYAEAMRLYLLAADAGSAASQIGLGVMFSKEFGVSRNPVLEYALYNLAHANGFGLRAEVNRDSAERTLTQEEVFRAQALSQEMLSSGNVSSVVKQFSETNK